MLCADSAMWNVAYLIASGASSHTKPAVPAQPQAKMPSYTCKYKIETKSPSFEAHWCRQKTDSDHN